MVLETGLLGVFVARDIILFYLFFEFTLLPLFFLIGVWGSRQRRYAAIKFFLFTLAGSVLTLLGLLAIVLWDWGHAPVGAAMTFSIPELTRRLAEHPIDPSLQTWIFLRLFAGFAVKTPLFPLHTWLPLAHVEAPAAGSVLLAGVLLKVGSYGFVRFNLPLLPQATAALMPWLLWLSVVGILYGALVALAQSDMKRLIAYSSVSHLGFCMLGVFALNRLAVQGGVLQMINHGLSTGGLFAVVGMLYDRYHTRQIADFGGLARQTPRLAAAMVFIALSSIGLPGLNGFAGEFLLLLGMFQRGWAEAPPALAAQYRTISVLAVAGVVLGAWYMLGLVRRVFFGPLREPKVHADAAPVRDLGLREVFALAPLAVLIVWIGVQPDFFLRRMAPTLDRLAAAASDTVHSIPREKAETRTVPLSLWERAGVRESFAEFQHRTAESPPASPHPNPLPEGEGTAEPNPRRPMHADTLRLLSPEIVLVVAAAAIYLAGTFLASPGLWRWLAGGAIAAAAAALWRYGLGADAGGPLLPDSLAAYGRTLALALGAVLLLLNWRPLSAGGAAERLGTLLLAIAGVMLTSIAGDLVLLFVSLEMISIPTYILLYLGRRDAACQESAAKYFFLSVFASAIFLYGLSFLYGTTGSTDLAAIRRALVDPAAVPAAFAPLVVAALALLFAGLSFRVAAVPFHFYAPDVYQGATHANAALLSVLPKAAGLIVLVRLTLGIMPGGEPYGWRIALGLAVASMTVGNVLALWQDNLRRLLAYSSIANAGYMLIGLAVGLASANAPVRWDGVAAMFFYLCVYAAATLGVFAVLIYLGRDQRQVEAVDDLAGLARTRPLAAAGLALFLFSLAGLPPLAGLWGKFFLFAAALAVPSEAGPGLRPWFVGLAIVGVLNAAVAAYYYLRIVAVMYFRDPSASPKPQGGAAPAAAAWLCAALVLGLFAFPSPLMRLVPQGPSPESQHVASEASTPLDEASPETDDGDK